MSRNGIEENVSVVYLISTWVLLVSNNGNQCAKFWLLIDRAAWNIPECEIKALASVSNNIQSGSCHVTFHQYVEFLMYIKFKDMYYSNPWLHVFISEGTF
jgi:hypothetical protein